jgi:type III pantothenate kinase
MFLAIDIGNTNITLGIYQGEILGPKWRFASDHDKSPDEYGASILQAIGREGGIADNIQAIAIASVVPPLTHTLMVACEKYLQCQPFVVDSTVNTGIRLLYEDPRQIGADRIVDVAAAYRLYGGPACVVDFGTATTFDAVSADGDYLGGAIAPGLGITAEALSQKTAKLPKVDLHRPPAAIGRNIVHSLQSGLLLGYVGLVEGMVARFYAELGPDMKVIATGGLAEVIAKETKIISILAPWLTLDGLRIIHELNTESFPPVAAPNRNKI